MQQNYIALADISYETGEIDKAMDYLDKGALIKYADSLCSGSGKRRQVRNRKLQAGEEEPHTFFPDILAGARYIIPVWVFSNPA